MQAAPIEVEPKWSRHWRWWVLALWLLTCAWFIHDRWFMIRWLMLPDTDDNMRLSQVRALMAGQGWWDLRQYKLNPPTGFNMHWSRLVDLPIALLITVFRPVLGGFAAERWASAIAPMLPLAVAMSAMVLVVRRLIARSAFVLALPLMLACQATLMMFMPMRIDHHGWQLAFLVLTIAGLVDREAWRGGMTMGLASAASLSIGLELIPFLLIAGAAAVLRWVGTPADRDRLTHYGASLALGCAAGFAIFTSYASSIPRCDVLSPVWLGVMVAAGWLAFLLPRVTSADWRVRLAAAAVGGSIIVAGFVLLAPQCLGRPEQISDELVQDWFKNIREAKPLYAQSWRLAVAVATLPVIGALGSMGAAVRAWRTPAFATWAPIAFVATTSVILLAWQTRMGPAAQLMAVPGATAIGWALFTQVRTRRLLTLPLPAQLLALVAGFVLLSGLAVQQLISRIPGDPPNARIAMINRANNRCPTLWAMAPIARLPATTIFTFVDLGPRLITVTHHRAIAGPYHRNGDAILDVHHAFGGTPAAARAIMRRHGATLLMTCPNFSEATVYRARTPQGFYSQLATGARFDWLVPVPLPADSPLLLWSIR